MSCSSAPVTATSRSIPGNVALIALTPWATERQCSSRPCSVGLVVVLGGRRAAVSSHVRVPSPSTCSSSVRRCGSWIVATSSRRSASMRRPARRAVEEVGERERARLRLVQAEQVDLRAVARMDAERPADVDRRAARRRATRNRSTSSQTIATTDAGPVGQRQAQELAAVALGARLGAAHQQHLVHIEPVLEVPHLHGGKRCKRCGRHSGRNHVRGVALAKMKLTWHEPR